MNNFVLLKESDFEFVGNKYSDKEKHLLSRTKLHKIRNNWRVYYYLPNGNAVYFNSVPKLKSKKEKEDYLAEFRDLLKKGFLPRSAAEIIQAAAALIKDGTFSVYTEKYFGIYAINENAKLKKSERSIRSILKRALKFFIDKGYTSISQITDDDLEEWDRTLPFVKKIRGKGCISRSTRNNWRKNLRAFLWMAERRDYALQCHPSKMNIYERVKGEIDKLADVRSIIFPNELRECILKSNFKGDLLFTADLRKVPTFLKHVGIRPGEFFTLSEYNITWKNSRPFAINIIDLPDCPYHNVLGFSPKKFCSYRTIELTDFAIEFLEETLKNVSTLKRYGIVNKKLVQFPFLFAFYSPRYEAYISDDLVFYKEFRDMVDCTIEEFHLPYKNIYELYDLRRSCNEWLKSTLGFTDEEASRYLGHSKSTNNKHYTLDEKRQQIRQAQGSRSLDRAIQSSKTVASFFSYRNNEHTMSKEDEESVSSLVPCYGSFVVMPKAWDIEEKEKEMFKDKLA